MTVSRIAGKEINQTERRTILISKIDFWMKGIFVFDFVDQEILWLEWASIWFYENSKLSFKIYDMKTYFGQGFEKAGFTIKFHI